MTTEETELTFIRCPSCRSLVPAVATRCRMCGHNFEAQSGESAPMPDPSKAKSRVRQRTISASLDEVTDSGNLRDDADISVTEFAAKEPASASPANSVADKYQAEPDSAEEQFEDYESEDTLFEMPSPISFKSAEAPQSAKSRPVEKPAVAPVVEAAARASQPEASPMLGDADQDFDEVVEFSIKGDLISSGSSGSFDEDEPLPDPMSADSSFDEAEEFPIISSSPVVSSWDEEEEEEEDGESDSDESEDLETRSDLGANPQGSLMDRPQGKKRRRRRRKRKGASGATPLDTGAVLETKPEQMESVSFRSQDVHRDAPRLDQHAANRETTPKREPEIVAPVNLTPETVTPVSVAPVTVAPVNVAPVSVPPVSDPRAFSQPEVRQEPVQAVKRDSIPEPEAFRPQPSERPQIEKTQTLNEPAINTGGTMNQADVSRQRANNGSISPSAPVQTPTLSDRDLGKLVGWLVSFSSDAKGVSIELRAGRFFIGGQRLREHDIVIADRGLSAPHCLVAAVPSSGLRVQDLMSEGGTFIKRRGASTFERVIDVVVVEHGDLLRFGDYEVTVCLLP